MSYQNIFQRYEIKYLITREQQKRIKAAMAPFMTGDAYGRSTVCSLYFDTPDYLLVRRSLQKPVYKEKLRLRSYGVAKPDSPVFIELKKKAASVVYKRRVSVSAAEAAAYFGKNRPLPLQNQITAEIDFFRQQYVGLAPMVLLSYEREAFYAKDDRDFRLTFDENILWRGEQLSLSAGISGSRILPAGQVLMELKTAAAVPLWMAHLLSREQIYPTSFSKYGNAYRQILQFEKEGDICYA